MTTEPIMTYWKSKGRVAEPKMLIDWEFMGRAMMESSVAKNGPANLQWASLDMEKT